MKKTLKAVVAMILVLALSFAMFSATAFAAAQDDAIVPQQTLKIGGFFGNLIKSVVNAVKSFFDNIFAPKPQPDVPTQPETQPEIPEFENKGDIVIDNGEYSGNGVGNGDKYAGGIW